MALRLLLPLLTLLTTATALHAEQLLLLPGYHEAGREWHYRGATQPLLANGWREGGILIATPYGIQAQTLPNAPTAPANTPTFWFAELATEAPLEFQQQQLAAQVSWLKSRYPHEPIHLAGHSAGGVVARLLMVRQPQLQIASLTTIAAPHLGTGMAEVGHLAAGSPLSPLLPLFGAESLNRSEWLMHDLSRESSGNLLFWLNRQPHPESRYLSVIRKSGSLLEGEGDWIVNSSSQNMNFVPALANRSAVILAGGDHQLNSWDGEWVRRFIAEGR